MPLAHTVNKLHYATCQHCCAQPVIPHCTVQTSNLLRESIFGPSVRLCPSICYQKICNISMNSVRDGLTELYRTRTNFLPMDREKAELSLRQDMTHLVERHDSLSRCLYEEHSSQSGPVSQMYHFQWCCLLIGADCRQSYAAVAQYKSR